MRTKLGNFMMGAFVASLLGTSFAQGAGGLQLDGVDDYVTMGVAPGLGGETFTLETWFQRTGTGSTASSGAGGVVAIPLVTKGRGEGDGSTLDMNYFLGIRGTDGVLVADFEEGATRSCFSRTASKVVTCRPVVGRPKLQRSGQGLRRIHWVMGGGVEEIHLDGALGKHFRI